MQFSCVLLLRLKVNAEMSERQIGLWLQGVLRLLSQAGPCWSAQSEVVTVDVKQCGE